MSHPLRSEESSRVRLLWSDGDDGPPFHDSEGKLAQLLRKTWREEGLAFYLEEYAKFLTIKAFKKDFLGERVFAPPVLRLLWESHVSDVSNYAGFCQRHLGKYIYPDPLRPALDLATLATKKAELIAAYVQVFGIDPDALWLETSDTTSVFVWSCCHPMRRIACVDLAQTSGEDLCYRVEYEPKEIPSEGVRLFYNQELIPAKPSLVKSGLKPHSQVFVWSRVSVADVDPHGRLLKALTNFRFPVNGGKADNLLEAYAEFMTLKIMTADYQAEKISPSLLIDQVWHLHILDVVNYVTFCRKHTGRLIEHDPLKAFDGEYKDKRIQRTYLAYEALFGHMPPLYSDAWEFGTFKYCGKPIKKEPDENPLNRHRL